MTANHEQIKGADPDWREREDRRNAESARVSAALDWCLKCEGKPAEGELQRCDVVDGEPTDPDAVAVIMCEDCGWDLHGTDSPDGYSTFLYNPWPKERTP